MTTKCPVCGREHHGCTLGELVKAVSRCCRGKRTRMGRRVISTAASTPPRVVPPVSLTFDRLVISQNKTTYSHWSRHHRDKHDWMSRVQTAGARLLGARLEWSRWELVRLYAPPNRELDYANLVGGAKPLIDSLIDCGIIVDDRPAMFECAYRQEKAAESKTILTLVETRDDASTE